MQAKQAAGRVDYRCRRKSKEAATRFRYGAGGPVAIAKKGSLEEFLVERYLLFSSKRNGRLYSGQAYHPPYQFCRADVSAYDTLPLEWNGFGIDGEPCSALFSSGPDVEVFSLAAL